MSRQIRRLGAVMLALFVLLFLNLNRIQLVQSDELANNPNNQRLLIKEYQIQRGPIVAGDVQIAHSVPTDGELKYLRRYEDPRRWSHVTGYYSIVLSRSGLEGAMNEALTGTPTEVLAQNLSELLGGRDLMGNTVRVTTDPGVQAAAADALGDRVGAVVALDPSTGAVLALHSSPGFDTNRLSSHDRSAILDYWQQLQEAQDRPLLNRAIRELYPPGSTFKLVVAAAALEQGLSPDAALEDGATFQPRVGQPIRNFGGGACTQDATISLSDALRISCNTAFASLGTNLGAEALREQAAAFGFDREPPLELPTVASRFPQPQDAAALAQSAIGQRDVRTTPLQMALISAAIANEGQLMEPHVVAEVLDPAGRTLQGPQVSPWSSGGRSAQGVSPRTARQLSDMMVDVVADGTGTAAQIEGRRVGGKTGTAETGGDSPPTVWFTGFVDDEVAVAVVLPEASPGATGGGEAAPVARAVMQAALRGGS